MNNEIKLQGEITIDTRRMVATKAGNPVVLTRHQYDILMYLAKDAGRPVSPLELAKSGIFAKQVSKNNIEVYVSGLRKKLGREVITTRRSFGYVVEVAA